jgi:predicted DNA-binding protein
MNKRRGRPALGKPGSHKMYTFQMPIAHIKKLRTLAKKEETTVPEILRNAVEHVINNGPI